MRRWRGRLPKHKHQRGRPKGSTRREILIARPGDTVYAEEGVPVYAYPDSTVHAAPGARVYAYPGARILAWDPQADRKEGPMGTARFIVEVEWNRVQGKFAARDEIIEAIQETLDDAQPDLSGLGADGDTEHEVTDWSVSEDFAQPTKKSRR